MRIAMVTPTFPPYQGGIGNVTQALSRALTARGHQIVVMTPDYGLHNPATEPFQVRRLRSVVRYGNAAFLPQLYWLLKGFDLIHLHYPFFGGAEATGLRAAISKTPLLMHYHHDAVGIGFRKTVFSIHRRLLLNSLAKRSARIVTTSIDYANFSDIGPAAKRYPEKLTVIPLGVDTTHFRPGPYPQALAEKLGVAGKKVVLFVGSLDSAHYFKGVNYLISATKQLECLDCSVLIVGEGDLRYSYEEMVRSYGLESRVRFIPDVSYEALTDYYRLANCVVLPSIDRTEAFGMVLLEALATGVPIIASDLPGVRTLIGQHERHGLLATPADADHLGRQILQLLQDGDMAKRYGQHGLATVEERYSWPVIAKEFELLYQHLVTPGT